MRAEEALGPARLRTTRCEAWPRARCGGVAPCACPPGRWRTCSKPTARASGARARGAPRRRVESAAMAAATAPPCDYRPTLPGHPVTGGHPSDAQLETVIRAGSTHGEKLPGTGGSDGPRQGSFLPPTVSGRPSGGRRGGSGRPRRPLGEPRDGPLDRVPVPRGHPRSDVALQESVRVPFPCPTSRARYTSAPSTADTTRSPREDGARGAGSPSGGALRNVTARVRTVQTTDRVLTTAPSRAPLVRRRPEATWGGTGARGPDPRPAAVDRLAE